MSYWLFIVSDDLNVKVTKLTTEVNGLKYKITLIDEDAVSSLRHQLTNQTQRANKAESEYSSLATRWNDLWKNPEIQEAWKQVQQRKEEKVRQVERRKDILDRLM